MNAVLQDLAVALPELTVEPAPASAGPWLLAAADAAPPLRIVATAARRPLWHPERVAEIAEDLDAAQDLLDRVEAVTGWRFEPATLSDAPHGDVVRVAGEGIAVELALERVTAVPPLLSAAAAAAPQRGDRPRPTALLVTGPSLPVEAAAALDPGDLLLLPLPAPTRIEGRDPARFALDPATGTLAVMRAPPEGSARSAFEIRTELRFADLPIPPDAIAEAERGEPLVLGPLPPALPVELAIAGRPVASGTLVRLGAAFAVRIDTLIAALEAAA